MNWIGIGAVYPSIEPKVKRFTLCSGKFPWLSKSIRVMPTISHGHSCARAMGRRGFLSPGPEKNFRWGSDRHGPRFIIIRRFSRHEPGLDHHAFGRGIFRAARARHSSAVSVPCLQLDPQSGRLRRDFLFALANDEAPAVAFVCLAVAYRMLSSASHG